MAIRGFGIYIRLLKSGHSLDQMGLKGTASDVPRWNARVKLARDFQGLAVPSLSEKTLKGYNAFFQVFLTHSALERYLNLIGATTDHLEPLLQPYEPKETIKEFFGYDKKGRLFDFLHERLDKERARNRLKACREGTCCNVAHVSAAVRHIFAHGHLTAHAHGINPNQVASACGTISEFLLNFMDADFTLRMIEYERSLALRP
jgi:hypothetical protein